VYNESDTGGAKQTFGVWTQNGYGHQGVLLQEILIVNKNGRGWASMGQQTQVLAHLALGPLGWPPHMILSRIWSSFSFDRI